MVFRDDWEKGGGREKNKLSTVMTLTLQTMSLFYDNKACMQTYQPIQSNVYIYFIYFPLDCQYMYGSIYFMPNLLDLVILEMAG